jgi:hypothetical protein
MVEQVRDPEERLQIMLPGHGLRVGFRALGRWVRRDQFCAFQEILLRILIESRGAYLSSDRVPAILDIVMRSVAEERTDPCPAGSKFPVLGDEQPVLLGCPEC